MKKNLNITEDRDNNSIMCNYYNCYTLEGQ